ncbi:MAG: hypothetical protein SPI69_05135 [Elusimicrobiaceae bacterium]|nr:hypothetical protein [Elusimicrobiaceae bacterium]
MNCRFSFLLEKFVVFERQFCTDAYGRYTLRRAFRRDKKYLQMFASAADEGMRAELLSAGESSVAQLGKASAGNISAWTAQRLDLHSKMERAL